MACVQRCGSAQAFHNQNKGVVNEMCKKAQIDVTNHCQHEKVHGAVTGGHIRNNAKGYRIKFLNKHDWSGQSKKLYPHTITKRHAGTFVHASDRGGHSDEAAVVYADECGSGWLLAWSIRDHCGGCDNYNKVYVEVGPIQNYMKIDWNAIKAKLDASSDTSYYVDEATGCEVFGKVSHGNKTAVVATFHNVYPH